MQTHTFPWIARVIFYFIKFNRQNHFQYNGKQSYNSRTCVCVFFHFPLWYLCMVYWIQFTVYCTQSVLLTVNLIDWHAWDSMCSERKMFGVGVVWSVTQISFVVVGFMWHITAIIRVMIYIFRRKENPPLSDTLADNARFFVLSRFIALMKI